MRRRCRSSRIGRSSRAHAAVARSRRDAHAPSCPRRSTARSPPVHARPRWPPTWRRSRRMLRPTKCAATAARPWRRRAALGGSDGRENVCARRSVRPSRRSRRPCTDRPWRRARARSCARRRSRRRAHRSTGNRADTPNGRRGQQRACSCAQSRCAGPACQQGGPLRLVIGAITRRGSWPVRTGTAAVKGRSRRRARRSP